MDMIRLTITVEISIPASVVFIGLLALRLLS